MIADDTFQRFVFDELNIRGEWVRLSESFQQATQETDYPPAIKALLGQTIAASVLLTGTLKFAGSLSIHARGEGPVSLLMAEATDRRTFRGIAKWLADAGAAIDSSDALAQLLGDAQLAITINPVAGTRYQGVVPLERDSLDACLAHYFELSEQLDTYLLLVADSVNCYGLMLQKLPGHDVEDDQDAWNRIVQLAKTLSIEEFKSNDNETLLTRLFHEEHVISFAKEVVKFECSCSRARSLASIKNLGSDDALRLLEQEATISVDCQFCCKHYEFDRDDITTLFELGSRH